MRNKTVMAAVLLASSVLASGVAQARTVNVIGSGFLGSGTGAYFAGEAYSLSALVPIDNEENNRPAFLTLMLGSDTYTSPLTLLPPVPGSQLTAVTPSTAPFDFSLYVQDLGDRTPYSLGVRSAYFAFSNVGFGDGSSTASASFITSPVPEPATWGMMILGMGAIGFAMRRRKNVRTTVSFA